MTTPVGRSLRHVRGNPCPVCGGWDEQDRGKGQRCAGFTSDDGLWCRCTQIESPHLDEKSSPPAWRHAMAGVCRCGARHGPGEMPTTKVRTEPEAEYLYRDAQGRNLCRVTRWPGKRFTQQAWSGAGWVTGVKDVPYTLYRLPEALASKGTVYVVEGEKDVETLRARRHVAVCTRGGATRADRSDWTPLKGRDVVVIADADDPGRKFAAEVVTCLSAVGARPTGPVECSAGKDVTDHIEAGGEFPSGLRPMVSPGAAKPAPARAPLRLVPPSPPSEEDVPWGAEEPPSADPPDKPEILMGPDLHRVVAELERHLAELDPGLYQRGRELVTVLGADGERGVADGTPVIRSLTQAAILTRITARVQFITRKPPTAKAIQLADAKGEQACATKGKIVPPTTHVVQPLLAQGEWPTVRLLRGITEAPCLRGDGTILQAPGYDTQTRYLYAPNAEYWPVPEDPTQADARSALAELRDLFVHFPFSEPAGSVVAIGALLTILARPAIEGPVPGFVFEASVRGAGKTLQCDVVHTLATGRPAPHGEWPANDEEQKKTMNGIALAAPSVCVFDNIKGAFGGSSIEAALTSDRVSFRVLGGLSTADVPWQTVVLASGNQIEPTDDMIRRLIVSRLEPNEEDPTTRTGLPDLRAIVRTRRPALVRAALTVLRAYASRGYPDAGARLASFDAWARIVPGAILFAGGPDLTAARLPPERATTDAMAAAYVIVQSLASITGTGGELTVKAILGRLYPPPESPDGFEDVREAIEAIAPPKGPRPDATLLGKRFSKLVGRWFGRARLVRHLDPHTKVVRWSSELRTTPAVTPATDELTEDDIPRT